MPSGSLWFVCIWLPGYDSCGEHRPMNGDPLLIAICCIGVAVIAVSWLARGSRFERAIAILCALPALAFAAIFGTMTSSGGAYLGVHLAFVSSTSLVLGCLVWEREARGRERTARYLLRISLVLMTLALALTALLSTWRPPPDHPIEIPYVGPT